MKKLAALLVIAALLAGSAAAAGVLIRAQSPAAGLNDAGYYAYKAGQAGAAEQLFLAAIAQDATYQRARYNLATLYFNEERYDDAAAQLETLVALAPDDARYRFDLAVNLVASMRARGTAPLAEFDRAIALYQDADRLSPGFPHATENAAVLERIRAELVA